MNRKNQFALSIIIACTLAASSYQGTFADDLDDQLQDIQGQIDESHNSQANWQEIIDQVNVKLRAIQVDLDAANARLKDIQNQQAQINAQIKQTQEERHRSICSSIRRS
jgi:peptidoglycan hydrolase CwlO-like protein